MNIRTILIILAGGMLIALLWEPIADSFDDTFQTEESRRAERMAAWAKQDSLSQDRSKPAESSKDSAMIRPAPPATPPEPEIPHLFTSETFLDSVQAQLENLPHFRGKKLMFHGDIHLYTYSSGRVEIEIQDPDIPENLDKYSYSDGAWKQPEPVKTYSSRDFRKALIPLDRIRFSTALKVLEKTRQVADSLNAGVVSDHVFFNNWPVFNRREWASSITGARRDYDLTFDIEGRLKSVKKR